MLGCDFPPSEIHYHIQEPSFKLSSIAQKITELNPKLLLGESDLFRYNEGAIALSPNFQGLLNLLVQLGEIDPGALTAPTLSDLNAILQQGLLRKKGTERWHLEDNPLKQKYRSAFESALQQLGFTLARPLVGEITVDHCLIFGALTERMETRICETVAYLQNNLRVTGRIFLLGSHRKLLTAEREHLQKFNPNLYWSEVFNDPEQQPKPMLLSFCGKVLLHKSSKISSFPLNLRAPDLPIMRPRASA